MEGSSFDSDRKAKEELAKGIALQKELEAQKESVAALAAGKEKSGRRYGLVRTPSREKEVDGSEQGEKREHVSKSEKKKKKKRSRDRYQSNII